MHPYEFAHMVDNIDPELKVQYEKVFEPQGTGPVALSPHFVFIVCNVLRGYAPVEVSEQVEREKQTFISADAVREYTLQFIPGNLIKQSMMSRYLTQMSKLDEIDVLENLCKIQLVRVMTRVDNPSVDAEDDESKRRDIDCLRKLTMDTIKAKMETGRYKKAPIQHQHEVSVNQSGEVVHRQELALPEPREAAEALRALSKIKKLTEPDADEPIH